MTDLISKAVASISSLLKQFQVKQIFSVVLVGFLVLTTNVDLGRNHQGINRVDDVAHQSDSQRPKTTGEWNREASEDVPLTQRIKDIAEDSAEAVKDFGSLYPDTAKRSVRDLKDN